MTFPSFARPTLITLCLVLTACGDASNQISNNNSPLSQSGNDWTFINYWAEWCKPCIKEIPELNALHASPGYAVLGVNFDGASGDELQRQLDALGVAFPTLDNDPAADFGVDRPMVLPTTLVVGPDGQLAKILIGPQTEASLIAATVPVTAPAGEAPGLESGRSGN